MLAKHKVAGSTPVTRFSTSSALTPPARCSDRRCVPQVCTVPAHRARGTTFRSVCSVSV
ncbi:MAG: hypothetical protein E6J77_19030 [Deltaproteobacteria bacterium]|nr:MAG: hypothetical protein E6J77_19030 [Deltaproteobacteria bacterium]